MISIHRVKAFECLLKKAVPRDCLLSFFAKTEVEERRLLLLRQMHTVDVFLESCLFGLL